MNTFDKNFRDRMKLALIPVLGLALAAVLFWRAPAIKVVADADSVSTLADLLVPQDQHPRTAKPLWPHLQLDEIIAFSPFEPPQIPTPALIAANSNINERINGLIPESTAPTENEKGVLQAVFRDARGTIAIYDSHIVRVGDVMKDGSRIVDITDHEVVLERN